MTIDAERFNAIRNARTILWEMMTKRPFPYKTKKELRKLAYRLSKHFPDEWFMEKLEELYRKDQEGGK